MLCEKATLSDMRPSNTAITTIFSGVMKLKLSQRLMIFVLEVFARVAPEQKDLILTTIKSVGRIKLMCGDGTNDVGALNQANVRVVLLNAIAPTQSEKSSYD